VGFRVSATAMRPANWPPAATSITVLPSPSRRVIRCSRSAETGILRSERRSRFPITTSSPRIRATTPFPPRVSKPSAVCRVTFRSSAFRTMASARGWSEFFSTLAARERRVASVMPVAATSVTSGFPLVRVPVLSKRMAVSFSGVSRASPLFIRIPSSAPRPIPTVTAVGVARPSAQGQAMTRTR